MSLSTHLDLVASKAVLSSTEEQRIATSVFTLKLRLTSYFGMDFKEGLQFGSSTRGTILPRSMDPNSDIDYLIVFKDLTLKPQTYISKLRSFSNKYYSSSEIKQSYPTVVLKLNHIMFDLVPSQESFFEEYRIPAPSSTYTDWINTSPNKFNTALTAKNINSNFKIKPTIRLLKYWNSLSGHVFDSYELEQWVVNRYFFSCTTVKDYFFYCIENLTLNIYSPQWKIDKLRRAKSIVANINELERLGRSYEAEMKLNALIPIPNV